MFKFDNSYARLPSHFHSAMETPNTWKPTLVAFNRDLANDLGLDVTGVSDETLASFFGASAFMEGSQPVAMAYAGMQFGHFTPQLGDGRAVLLGEVISPKGERFDIHLKGSGRTPYSRRGDGLSALGPVLREYIVSEGMYALGVPTTRTLCAVRTGELVQREHLTPGGVMARVARSHIRVGTFQFFAGRNDMEGLKTLTGYTIDRLYPHLNGDPDRLFKFWSVVGERQMRLVAQWMSLGFIHGVMNTDNMNVSGETIDYGPCAFMDEFVSNKVFSSIDQQGRYAFNNQGKIALWNLARLAECLLPMLGGTPEEHGPRYSEELSRLFELHQQEYTRLMSEKLGLRTPNVGLVTDFLRILEEKQFDYTLSLIELERGEFGDDEFVKKWKALGPAIELMKKVNPSVIPRNHLIERAIQAANRGDDSVFTELVGAVRNPYIRTEHPSSFQSPPIQSERVTRTFCGT